MARPAVDRPGRFLCHALRGLDLEVGYRMDLVVDRTVLVEIKAVEKLHPVVTAQALTYLRLSGLRAGLICNFHVELLKDGIRRVVL